MDFDLSQLNVDCTGDVVAGDTILFTEPVFAELFSISGKHYGSKPLGHRRIIAKVVKESYGEKKQQHTFTLMVIYCDGHKRLKNGERIFRKGRVIYRNGTLRKAWDNEDARKIVRADKHRRGEEARQARARRIYRRSEPNVSAD